MQNYNNHGKKYFLQVAYILLSFAGLVLSIVRLVKSNDTDSFWLWLLISLVFILLIWQSIMTRIHYALIIQNRMIVNEVRFRYFRLTGNSLEDDFPNLKDTQIFAVRFASDAELSDLLKKADQENLDSDALKKSIKNWRPDHRRV